MITAANASLYIGVLPIFPVPQKIQQFAADDIFDVDPQEVAETFMGVDGNLTAGFVFTAVRQGITLMADSSSNSFFDAWHTAEVAAKEKLPCFSSIQLPSLGLKFAMPKGFLVTFQAVPSAGRTMRPRKHYILWETVLPSLI